MKLPATAIVLSYLRSIANGDAVASHAETGAVACAMPMRSYGACMAMLVSRGYLAGRTRDQESHIMRYTITPAGQLWLEDMTNEYVRVDGRENWTDAMRDEVRELWNKGDLSTAEIGRRVGMSKNAIVGAAHRMGLDAKPSPIAGHDAAREAVSRPVRALAASSTIPPLVSYQTTVERHAADRTPSPFDNVVYRPVRAAQPMLPIPTTKTCQYPVAPGNQVGFPWLFCGKPAVIRSYCLECSRICFVNVRRIAA